MIEAAIRKRIIDLNPTMQVHVGIAPKGTSTPYTVIVPVVTNPIYSHQGESSLRNVVIQVSCFGGSYTEAKTEGINILSALSIFVPVSLGTTTIKQSLLHEDYYQYEDDVDIHHIAYRFGIYYTE